MKPAPQAPAAGGLVELIAGDLEFARTLEAYERGDAPPVEAHAYYRFNSSPGWSEVDTWRVLLHAALLAALERAGIPRGSLSDELDAKLGNALLERRAAACVAQGDLEARRRLHAARVTEWIVRTPASSAPSRTPATRTARARARRAPRRRRAGSRRASPGRQSADDDPEPEPLTAASHGGIGALERVPA
jgi:hypothetical protein